MKKRIRNISIGFLAVMFALTLFSRVMASVTTAVVSTQRAVSGKISHTVSLPGKVEAVQEISVTIPGQRIVEAVYVRAGDRVEVGEALLRLSENSALTEAEDAFAAWELYALMALETARDAYLAAYESWQEYLAGTSAFYGKSDADQEEDSLERAMREVQYEYFDKYKSYLEDFTKWQEKAIENENVSDANVKRSHKAALSVMEKMQAAKDEYYEYRRSHKEVYRYSRSEEEKKRRETLENTIYDYETALAAFDDELMEKAGNISEASDGLSDDGTVYADTAGTVKEVNLRTGDWTGISVAVVMAADSEQKKITVAVPAEYAEYLAVGDSVTVKKYGETDAISEAELVNIQYDETDTGKLSITVAATSAALEWGETVKVTFDHQSEPYGMLVPANAIHVQNNETYVMIVQETEGILGTVLTAQRINVEILDRNSSYAAISASDVSGQEIIIRSDREVRDGNRIRKQV